MLIGHAKVSWREWLKAHRKGRDLIVLDPADAELAPPGRFSLMRGDKVIAGRFFNTLVVISPQGEIVHKAAKNHLWCRERSCVPHDVYDRWTELFGDGTDAFYPVLRTNDIGNIGTICCSDGEYPEAVPGRCVSEPVA